MRDQNGNVLGGAAVAWSSGGTAVATVSSSGLVTAADNGTVTITAMAGSASGTATVTVAQQVSSVEVSPATNILVALGDTLRLAAEALDANGHAVAGAEFGWSSDDASVAEVDSTGLVTAAGSGTAMIAATTGEASDTAIVTVAPEVSAVAVSPAADTLVAGDTLRLAAEATDANGHAVDGAEFAWASSDTAVAAVDGSGLVTGVGAGVATVTATSSGATGGAELTVVAPVPTSLAVTPDTVTLTAIGETAQLAAEVRDQIGRVIEDAPVSWSSADTMVVAVDSAGLVTAIGGGTTTVTATSGEASGATSVKVMHLSVTVSPAADTIAPGDTLRLVAEAFDENGHAVDGAHFVWSSSDGSVATVDGSGLVEGVAEGRATITAAYGDARGTSEITVEDPQRTALVALYNATDGPNWLNNTNWLTDAPLGEWYGVSVDAAGSVVGLRLAGNNLNGPIPPKLGGLAGLRSVWFQENNLDGPIPVELGTLANLREIGLWANQLTDPIPQELGSLTELRFLVLAGNQFTGPIPPGLGGLDQLETLQLQQNRLTGPIPPELGGLEDLRRLSLDNNRLTGAIPPELGNLGEDLRTLTLEKNRLTGPLPQSLLDLVGLTNLRVDSNQGICVPGTALFVAWIERIRRHTHEGFCNESDVAALRSVFEAAGGSSWTASAGWLDGILLEEWYGVSADSIGRVVGLDVSDNGLSGQLSSTVGALSHMTRLRIGGNAALTGPLPLSLSGLPLREFGWAGTDLCHPANPGFREWLNRIPVHNGTGEECAPLSERDILEALFDATGGDNWINNENWLSDAPLGTWHGVTVDAAGHVTRLSFSGNNLSGQLPLELNGLSELEVLLLWSNPELTVPLHLLNLTSLTALLLGGVDVGGSVPPELGRLHNLREVSLQNTGLSGPIPPELGNLSGLRSLRLEWNDLSGPIPSELGSLSELETLYLGNNRLTGAIPPELGNLVKLRSLGLWLNRLTGPIPPELGKLARVERLQLGDNEITGAIPPDLGKMRSLKALELYRNRLAGGVPPELGGLASLSKLVLNGNAGLAGPVPTSLTALAKLDTLATGDTDLCAPGIPEFERWLDGLRFTQLRACSGAASAYAYLTQPIQSHEFLVPLVAGRAAMLRVFASAPRATAADRFPSARATFYLGGTEAHTVDMADGSGPIPAAVDEGDLSLSANVLIPARVVQPGLEMVVEIDTEGTLDPTLGVSRRLPETGRTAVEVAPAPVLDLTLVPLLWTEAPDSAVVTAARDMAADPEGHELLRETRALLPIGGLEVAAHKPVLTSSNWGDDMISLLKVIRTMEGGTGHYHGLYAGNRPDGIGGQGAIPGRVGWSELSGAIIAHELGHNLSLWHAPSAVRSLNYLDDPLFPATDGSIGAWGYDFETGGLVPPSSRDVMGGSGNPPWISGYHFTKAFRFQLSDEGSDGAAAAIVEPARSILLWGGANAEGEPRLEPALVVDVPPSLPEAGGDAHKLSGRDADGRTLFSLSFDMVEIGDSDGTSSFVFALPVEPGWEGRLASITLSGPGGEDVLDGSTDRPLAILRDPGSGQVRAFLRGSDVPTAIRMKTAGAERAALAAASGSEVLFSRGIPDASAWRR